MSMTYKTLGVIGGLGPAATSHFMELVIHMTQAQADQEHLDMIVYHAPSIPDRNSYILDHTRPSPLPHLIRLGQQLSQQGVGCIAIPCVTAHCFYEDLRREVSVPILHGIEATASLLRDAGIQKVGIMATTGTVQTQLFQNKLTALGIEPIVPDQATQKDVMHLIFDCIKADRPADMAVFRRVEDRLRGRGAQVILLGCTELSLIKRDNALGPGFLDVLEVLARQAVLQCGAPLKEEYQQLIT